VVGTGVVGAGAVCCGVVDGGVVVVDPEPGVVCAAPASGAV
jgi:hypothetical protein